MNMATVAASSRQPGGRRGDAQLERGAPAFHPAGPSDAEVATALATIGHRVQRLRVRHGLEPAGEVTGPADRSPRSPGPGGDRGRLSPAAIGARRTQSCLRGEASSALIRSVHMSVDDSGVPA